MDEKIKGKAIIIQFNPDRDEFNVGGYGVEVSEEYIQWIKDVIHEARWRYPFDPEVFKANPEIWAPVVQEDYILEIHGRGDQMRIVSNSGSYAFDAYLIACVNDLVDKEPDGMGINGVPVADA